MDVTNLHDFDICHPLKLKARALSMIRDDCERKCISAMVIDGEIHDFEISQGSGSQFSGNYTY